MGLVSDLANKARNRSGIDEKILDDVNYPWTGEAAFKLTNPQLHRVLEKRKVPFESDANKRALVAAVMNDQVARGIRSDIKDGEGELLAERLEGANADAAASFLHGDEGQPYDGHAPQVEGGAGHEPIIPLMGSNSYEAVISLDDETGVQLGYLVAVAHKNSGLTVVEWNELEQAKRDELIEAALEEERRQFALAQGAYVQGAAQNENPLLGSPNLMENVKVDTNTFIKADDIVKRAHHDSSLSIEEWNHLAQDTRDTFIAATAEAIIAAVQSEGISWLSKAGIGHYLLPEEPDLSDLEGVEVTFHESKIRYAEKREKVADPMFGKSIDQLGTIDELPKAVN